MSDLARAMHAGEHHGFFAEMLYESRVVQDDFEVRERLVKPAGIDRLHRAHHSGVDVIGIEREDFAELDLGQHGLVCRMQRAGKGSAGRQLILIDFAICPRGFTASRAFAEPIFGGKSRGKIKDTLWRRP